ncbi:MAG: spike base protein, RCAP_Rcc01079 family [Methyloligellaceae bacterium]
MTDNFKRHTSSLESPASGAFAITPDNSNSLSEITRAIYIGGAGDLAVTMQAGQEVTFSSLPAGTVLPVRVERVKATGTTATALLGLI